jgi:hypothetical protein
VVDEPKHPVRTRSRIVIGERDDLPARSTGSSLESRKLSGTVDADSEDVSFLPTPDNRSGLAIVTAMDNRDLAGQSLLGRQRRQTTFEVISPAEGGDDY